MEYSDFQHPSLTEVAYKEIREGILTGALPPGRKLVVNELVDEWKISNTPIKEALNRLVAEELVEAMPRRGMRVRKYTSVETREIFEMRTLYESHCARIAASTMNDRKELGAMLSKILDECRIILKSGSNEQNPMRLFDLDAEFHRIIVSQCGNTTMIRHFDRLHAHTLAIGMSVNATRPLRRWRETQKEHEQIYAALKVSSPQAAEKAMRVHLANTASDLLAFFNLKSGRLQKRKYTRNND